MHCATQETIASLVAHGAVATHPDLALYFQFDTIGFDVYGSPLFADVSGNHNDAVRSRLHAFFTSYV